MNSDSHTVHKTDDGDNIEITSEVTRNFENMTNKTRDEKSEETLSPIMQPPEEKMFKKKLIAKVDRRLLLMLVVMYILACLDRTNIGNARLAGLERDLGLTADQFQISLATFYVGYVLLEVPSNIVIGKFTPSKWIPFLMMLWSIAICCMSAVKRFPDLVVTRFVLGITEAGFAPGSIFLLSMWYKRSQFALRFSIFFSGSVLAGAFGGILAYLIIDVMKDAGGLEGWRWLFLIEGLCTLLMSFVAFFVLPNFPENANFLTPKEKNYLVTRLSKDDGSLHNPRSHKEFSHRGLLMSIKDWKVYHNMVSGICGGIALHSITLYLPTLIHSMGFNSMQSQLLTVPPYLFGWIFSLMVALHSDRTKERSWHIVASTIVAIVGYIGLATLESKVAKYISTFFITSGVWSMIPLILAWFLNIHSYPHDKRSIAIAMIITVSNCSGIIASMLYQPKDGPRFVKTNVLIASLLTLTVILVIFMRFMLHRENEKMNSLAAKNDTTSIDKSDSRTVDVEKTVKIQTHDEMDVEKREHEASEHASGRDPQFRYIL
ncbi:9002_t:CDS:10 [Acaulospora morrowiae]|uniref:9002_t:CDS:1 n=1 Tax=Acaulospora morrowiae TaxID=94023 RepID=A0A9N8Z324_9GLOM|nr:9002_t:CDS:10 [Acaulospora morrowiae]